MEKPKRGGTSMTTTFTQQMREITDMKEQLLGEEGNVFCSSGAINGIIENREGKCLLYSDMKEDTNEALYIDQTAVEQYLGYRELYKKVYTYITDMKEKIATLKGQQGMDELYDNLETAYLFYVTEKMEQDYCGMFQEFMFDYKYENPTWTNFYHYLKELQNNPEAQNERGYYRITLDKFNELLKTGEGKEATVNLYLRELGVLGFDLQHNLEHHVRSIKYLHRECMELIKKYPITYVPTTELKLCVYAKFNDNTLYVTRSLEHAGKVIGYIDSATIKGEVYRLCDNYVRLEKEANNEQGNEAVVYTVRNVQDTIEDSQNHLKVLYFI